MECFNKRGFAILPPSRSSVRFAAKILNLKVDPKAGERISGDVKQYNLLERNSYITQSERRFNEEYCKEWRALVKKAFKVLDIEGAIENKAIVAPKLLIAPPGKGEQAVHWGQIIIESLHNQAI